VSAVAPRSYLFAPGDDARKVEKALVAGADAVVLDLEDAVAAPRKGAARELVAAALAAPAPEGGPLRLVRLGAVRGGPGLDDLAAVFGPGLTAVRLPKLDAAEDVRLVAEALATLEGERGLPPGTVRLQCTIESAAGVLRAEAIASAHPRVEALVFGEADFLADIGAARTRSGEESLLARSHMVLASRAAGIGQPIDGAFTALDDEEGLVLNVARARRLGFGAKSAIHPRQLAAIHAGFAPTAAEVRAAREQLAALEAALGRGSAAATTAGGQFVDEAVARQARAVLARAAAGPATGGDT